MATSSEQPVAVRATAYLHPSKWRRRPVRRVYYDAYWPDGRVESDVNLVRMMYQGSPADFDPIDKTVHATCPEVGTGQWVNKYGGTVDGPAPIGRILPGSIKGRPRKYKASLDEPNPQKSFLWRLCYAVANLGIGTLIFAGRDTDGVVGFIGCLCILIGIAALANLFPVKRRYR